MTLSPKGPCTYCGAPAKDSHSLTLAGICDGIRNGKLTVTSTRPLTCSDKDGKSLVYDQAKNSAKYDRTRED